MALSRDTKRVIATCLTTITTQTRSRPVCNCCSQLFVNANLRSHISDQTPAVSACQRCRQVPRWLVTIPYRLEMPPRSSLLLKPPCCNLRLTWVLPSILLVLSGQICYRFVRRTKSPSSLLDPAESAQILIRNRCRAAVFTLFDPSPTSWC